MNRDLINPLEIFEQAIEEIYIQEQINIIDRLCRESDESMSTSIDTILSHQNRNLQRLRYERVLNLETEPVPANQYSEEIGNPIVTTTQLSTGDISTVFRNIFSHMENEMIFSARTNIMSNFDNFNEPVKITLSEHQYNEIQSEKVESGECHICLDEFKNTICKKLSCGHHYHDKCIKPWLTEQSTCCPVCRVDIKNNI